MQIEASSHGFPRGMLAIFWKTDTHFDSAEQSNTILVLRKNLLHFIRSWQHFSLLPGSLLDEYQNNPLHRLLFLRLLCPVCVEVSQGLELLYICFGFMEYFTKYVKNTTVEIESLSIGLVVAHGPFAGPHLHWCLCGGLLPVLRHGCFDWHVGQCLKPNLVQGTLGTANGAMWQFCPVQVIKTSVICIKAQNLGFLWSLCWLSWCCWV